MQRLTKFQNVLTLLGFFVCAPISFAQVASVSDGRDGVFNPNGNIEVNMSDHPDGVYRYESVNIPSGVNVTFIPNANNTPIFWLIKESCVIEGSIDLSGLAPEIAVSGRGGPGGYRGGNGGSNPSHGMGPGGGAAGSPTASGVYIYNIGTSASHATEGWSYSPPKATTYGNSYLLPLVGGSGGGGGGGSPGGGGGGAMLIVATVIKLNGTITSKGGNNAVTAFRNASGAGSGGAIRLVCDAISGSGTLMTRGGGFYVGTGWGSEWNGSGGDGWIRIDSIDDQFSGNFQGRFSRGYQPLLFPDSNANTPSLAIVSIASLAVPSNPSSNPVNPAVLIPPQEVSPIQVVIKCSNLPLNSLITVSVSPVIGERISIVGRNSTGTFASSVCTTTINMPRGGGIIYATVTK